MPFAMGERSAQKKEAIMKSNITAEAITAEAITAEAITAEAMKPEAVKPFARLREWAKRPAIDEAAAIIEKAYNVAKDAKPEAVKEYNATEARRALDNINGIKVYFKFADTATHDIRRAFASILAPIDGQNDPDTITETMTEFFDMLKTAAIVTRAEIDNEAPTRSYLVRNLKEYDTASDSEARTAAANYLNDTDDNITRQNVMYSIGCAEWVKQNVKETIARRDNAEALNKVNTAVMTKEQKAAYEAFLATLQ